MKIISPKDSNIKLIIAGNGIELQHLKHLVATYKLEHSVSFTGKVSEIELIKLYKEADIVLLPSIFPDPAPLISMEAMYYGKPLIASNIGGIPESVNHGVNGFLVPPNDPKKTANAILELVNNPGLRYHMGKKGREEFEKKFSNDELISRTLKLYQTQL
jgi:glycosyltransferase involved in cell wall biosynthesis